MLKVSSTRSEVEVNLIGKDATLLDAQAHDRADVFALGDDSGLDERLFHKIEVVGVGQVARVHDLELLSPLRVSFVPHVRNGLDHGHVELTLEPLLDDFHVEHAKKAAAEPKPQRRRALRLKHQRRAVQLASIEARSSS